jgi:hypothetical protein
MSLKDILNSIVEKKVPVLLGDSMGEWTAESLLDKLSEPLLRRKAHMQPGLYIAAVDEKGYLGDVLYRIKQNA